MWVLPEDFTPSLACRAFEKYSTMDLSNLFGARNGTQVRAWFLFQPMARWNNQKLKLRNYAFGKSYSSTASHMASQLRRQTQVHDSFCNLVIGTRANRRCLWYAYFLIILTTFIAEALVLVRFAASLVAIMICPQRLPYIGPSTTPTPKDATDDTKCFQTEVQPLRAISKMFSCCTMVQIVWNSRNPRTSAMESRNIWNNSPYWRRSWSLEDTNRRFTLKVAP